MKSFNLIKLAAVTVFGFVAVLGTSQLTSAQSSRGYNQQGRTIIRQRTNVAANWQNERNDRYNGNRSSFNNYNDRYQVNRGRSYYNNDRRYDRDDYNGRNSYRYNRHSPSIIGAILRSVRIG